MEQTLFTRIVIRNDSSTNWINNGSEIVLLKGEMAIEFDSTTGKPKIKIGDGVTKYPDLEFYGKEELPINIFEVEPTADETHEAAITRVVGSTTLTNGSIAIVKTAIVEGVYEYTSYVYNGTWLALNSNIEINENTLTHDANGKLNLYGFAEAVTGAQLLKGADGKLQWVKPDQTTIEGITTTVEGLEKDVADINTELGNPAAEGVEATGIYALLQGKANSTDVYTKEETDSAIATAIADVDTLKRITVESFESIDPAAENADKFIYMVPKTGTNGDYYDEYMVIDGKIEKVGGFAIDLADYAKTADVEAAIQDATIIKTVDTTQFAIDDDKNLTLLDIAMSKITGLSDALDDKVTAVEGSRLMTDAEGTKLAGIADGAEVNVIKTVTESQFAIDENKNLSLAEELLTKLNTADANIIEIVKVNGTPVQVADDKSIDITIPNVKASDEVTVAEDGTLGIGEISFSKIKQTPGDVLILNGGNSTEAGV